MDLRWRTIDEIVEAFREYLVRTRGACGETQHKYAQHVRSFLEDAFADGGVDVGALVAADVVRFVTSLAAQGRPRKVAHAVSALRAFLRFLRVHGLREDRLEEVVPGVRRYRLAGLPRHIDAEDATAGRVARSFNAVCGRDRAIVLAASGLARQRGRGDPP